LAFQDPSLDDDETRRIFSLTKPEMLKRAATLSPETCMVKGVPRQKRKGEKACAMLQAALAWEGGAQ